MEINGKTVDRSAYRLSLDVGAGTLEAHVSDALLSAEHGREGAVSHEEAYEWIAANRHAIEDAVRARIAGKTPRKPFDQIDLAASAGKGD